MNPCCWNQKEPLVSKESGKTGKTVEKREYWGAPQGAKRSSFRLPSNPVPIIISIYVDWLFADWMTGAA